MNFNKELDYLKSLMMLNKKTNLDKLSILSMKPFKRSSLSENNF